MQDVLKSLQGNETANFEFPLITKEGARVEILLNATSRLDPAGKISGVVGIGQDITARIAQEQEYIRIDTANAPIFGVDANGQVDVERVRIQLAGYSRDEVMGHNLVDEFISKEFQSSVKQVRGRATRFRKRAIVRRRHRQF